MNFNIEEAVEELFDGAENLSAFGAKIKVIGVGGGGGNMISHILRSGAHKDIELVAANTDAQALSTSGAHIKLQLGEKLTKGLGAGMRPETGRDSAVESFEELKCVLEGADIVFIAAGLGGGTGTGAAPIIAQAAREVGALTVSVVTKPFRFEGNRRGKLADIGLAELKKESDSIVVIPNDKLLSIVEKNYGIKDSFKIVDDVLARAVNGMSGIILTHGQNDINVDFADVRTVMSHKGLALMGMGESSGSNAAAEAIRKAIESPLFDNMSINGAMGVLVHFHINAAYPMVEINNAMEIVNDYADPDADVIFGTTTDDSISPDSVKITIVATGFEKEIVKANTPQMAQQPQKLGGLRLVTPMDESKKEAQQVIQVRKVSGGYEEDEDYLDIPTFMRKQMD